MSWESSNVFRFDLEPLLQGQMRTAKHKSAYNSLIIGPRGLQCETDLWDSMAWESSNVVRLDLVPLLQKSMPSQKSPTYPLSLFLGVWDEKTTWKSWSVSVKFDL